MDKKQYPLPRTVLRADDEGKHQGYGSFSLNEALRVVLLSTTPIAAMQKENSTNGSDHEARNLDGQTHK